jgi:hypothetical protein
MNEQYRSPIQGLPDGPIAALTAETSVARLNRLTEALRSLRVLQKAMDEQQRKASDGLPRDPS